jgi:mRNA-degrading endonuclease RelE of RelBE toxin-antitoxin system
MEARYIVDENGKHVSVILPVEEYERLLEELEELEDIRAAAEARVAIERGEDRRIRVGNYRVVYGVRDEEQIVEVLNVGHRRDVYRRGWKCNASRQRSTA